MTQEEYEVAQKLTRMIHEDGARIPSDAFVHLIPYVSDGQTTGIEVQLGVERYGQWVYAGARPFTLRYLEELKGYPTALRALESRLWTELGQFWERVNTEYLT